MYRLNNAGELFDIGWEDYLDRGGICVVEWSERVADALENCVTVTIEPVSGAACRRKITIEGWNKMRILALKPRPKPLP